MKTLPQFSNRSMTRDELYEAGYNDGLAGIELADDKAVFDDYVTGWKDGVGETMLNSAAQPRPVDDDWYSLNSPPTDFDWAGEKRTPEPGDFYLSKNGNPIYSWKVRKNSQERHILYLKGHEGHDVHPERDTKTPHVWCKTCSRIITLQTHKV